MVKVHVGSLKRYVFDFLVEGRVEDAQEKYPEIPEEDFDTLVHNQPAGSNNKYLLWACKQVDDGFSTEVTIQAVRLFDGNVKRLEKKDISQYKEPGEIEDAVQKLGASKGQQSKQIKGDTDVIYKDERFLILRPHTSEASCKYGTGTKWCIAATASHNYFKSYSTSNNKFYFVIDKTAEPNSPNSKFAFAIIDAAGTAGDRIQIYDATDKQVSASVVSNHVGENWPAIWNKIQQHVAANPTTREVDDAKKATEEHVQALLAGEPVSKEGLTKILHDADLTVPVMDAIFKRFESLPEPTVSGFYSDERYTARSEFSRRIGSMEPAAAMKAIKWTMTIPQGNDSWYLEQMITNANLSPHNFYELARNSGSNEQMLGYIISNRNAPADLKDQIAANYQTIKDTGVKRKIFTRLIQDGTITEEQMKLAMNDKYSLGSTILYTPSMAQNLSPEMLRLIPIKSSNDFKKFIEIPNVPPDYVAVKLLEGWDKFEKYDLIEILKSVTLSTDLIEKLWSEKKDREVRFALLQNPSIGAENAAKLATSKNSAHRFAVAHNTVTPPESLDILANDESVSTRAAVGANPKTDPKTLSRLATDEATAVRASVAGNSSTPQQILRALTKDGDSFVRKVARKTLRSLTAAEAVIRNMLSMQHILIEALDLDDEELKDTMSPDWRDIPQQAIKIPEFVAVFLLQNNGHATREEISDAFQDWRGKPGNHELWSMDRHAYQPHRGTTPSSKAWWWSPAGITKGSLFRLTPAGATAAMMTLERLRKTYPNASTNTEVTWSTARKGRTYYTQQPREALDVTGYEDGYVNSVTVWANDKKEPLLGADGKPQRAHTRYGYNQRPTTVIYEFVPMKENGHPNQNKARFIGALDKVKVPKNAKVEFIKTWHPSSVMKDRYVSSHEALVKYKDRSVIVGLPLWVAPDGAQPSPSAPGKRPQPPVKKSAPPAELIGDKPQQQPSEPEKKSQPQTSTSRGPKLTYKVYGRHRGHPAHARLKGQAYVAPHDTKFKSGEQTHITAADGKLQVKKVDGDHTQTWEPSDG